MNSKERVKRSMLHNEVDRVPVFYLGTPLITKNLCRMLELPEEEEALLKRMDVDVRFFHPRFIPGPGRFQLSMGAVHSRIYRHGGAVGPADEYFPLQKYSSVDEIEAWNCPNPDWYDYTINKEYRDVCKEKACVAYDMGIIFLYAMGLRGMEEIMLDMAGNPEMAEAIFRKIAEWNLERTRRFLEVNQGFFDILGLGDDIAGQNGMFFSVKMWRRFLKPHIQKMVNLCHQYNVFPYFHGCGGFRALFPDFIEMGISAVGRLQTEAIGNNFEEIKREFGERLCLWGAIDGQHIMIEEDSEGVKEHVNSLLRIGTPGSGFVAGPTHSFTDDTPVENILLVYQLLTKFDKIK